MAAVDERRRARAIRITAAGGGSGGESPSIQTRTLNSEQQLLLRCFLMASARPFPRSSWRASHGRPQALRSLARTHVVPPAPAARRRDPTGPDPNRRWPTRKCDAGAASLSSGVVLGPPAPAGSSVLAGGGTG